MSLLIDDREAIGDNPGLHVLVVGVSNYPFLKGGTSQIDDHWEMETLTSTATSAFKIVEWLRQAKTQNRLPVPLATCRVLLSPSPGESALHGIADRATLDNLVREAGAWRRDAQTNPKHITAFYFAGHGIARTKRDAVICLENFRDPDFQPLDFTADFESIRGGLSPSNARPDIARHQWYVMDACRLQPEQMRQFEPLDARAVFARDLSGNDDRAHPTFYAAVSNHLALAVPGGQTLFSRAIIECLDGDAAEVIGENAEGDPTYGVSCTSLNNALRPKLDALNRELGADQIFTTDGNFDPEHLICTLPTPPMVDVSLFIEPADACEFARVSVTNGLGVEALSLQPVAPHPVRTPLPFGIYTIDLSFTPPHPPFVNRTRSRDAAPPRTSWKVRVSDGV